MCISVLSTSHPEYPFVLISNRDEYINRPTLTAKWWDAPHEQVLGGRDTQRQERGTWLGITKQGRIAILTNFREEGVEVNRDKSRGAITNSYLCVDPNSNESEEAYVRRLLNDVGIHDVGGFTLIFGKLRKPKQTKNASPTPTSPTRSTPRSPSLDGSAASGLAVISNRTETANSLRRIATRVGETHGLSNSHFGDETWPKVIHGELRLQQAIKMDVMRGGNETKFIEGLFDILCLDMLPQRKDGEDWEEYVRHMRDSIMIPPAKGELAKQMAGYIPASTSLNAETGTDHIDTLPPAGSVAETAYGTSKQTVILVNKEGKVIYVERSLYDQHGTPIPEDERDVRYEFNIEGWSNSS
ncbi:Putative transport and Golgi organization protein [Septoria linicola]|uniref:Transport and Golgi organization protein n=1 Tax=Septoria linicola TaxID=215465 RepID=A0A9Q9AYM6_9PEZI|nr:Putative transport and Golgi organization protein [Septoria linicola]